MKPTQRPLLDALASQPVPDAGSPREQLEALLGAETLAELDAKILETVAAAAREPEREPLPFFEAVAEAKAAKRHSFLDAVRGRSDEPPEEPARRGGFDGGARELAPRKPPSHDEWLVGVIRSRAADVGGQF